MELACHLLMQLTMQNLNRLGSYGAHPKDFSPRQVREALIGLCSIVEWYVKWGKQGLAHEEDRKTDAAKFKREEEEYRQIVIGVLADGIINEAEREWLTKKAGELGLSEEAARKIEEEVKRNT